MKLFYPFEILFSEKPFFPHFFDNAFTLSGFDIYLCLLPLIFSLSSYSHCLVFKVHTFNNVLFLLLKKHGGDEENRTPDPLLARQVLSQLSYTPKFN